MEPNNLDAPCVSEGVGGEGPYQIGTPIFSPFELPPLSHPEVCAQIRSELSVPAVRHEHAPSMAVTESCSESNYYQPGSADAVYELHVVSVYEAVDSSQRWDPEGRPIPDQTGSIVVTVNPTPKPVVLFLSAHAPIEWQIQMAYGAQVAGVVTAGFYAQTVIGSPVRPIALETYCADATGWEADKNVGGRDFEVMIEAARRLTGMRETTFQGCYAGDQFVVPHAYCALSNLHPPFEGDETVEPTSLNFPGCETVQSESHYCITFKGEDMVMVGLDSGDVCHLHSGMQTSESFFTSLAWRGEVLYQCSEFGVVRIDLQTGNSERLQIPCGGLAFKGTDVYLHGALDGPLRYMGWSVYSGMASVLWGNGTFLGSLGTAPGRWASANGYLYGMMDNPNVMTRYELPSLQEAGAYQLEDYAGLMWGLSVTEDGWAVFMNEDLELVAYDIAAEQRIRQFPQDEASFGGYACIASANR